MAEIRPFRAIRYAGAWGADISSRIAPPYDVLSEQDKAAMLAADPRNIVAADLPHTPPKSAGPAAAYQRSADLLTKWLADGSLVRESAPAVFAYRQVFEVNGVQRARRGFIARVRAEQFRASPAGIFPHEQTFSGPKEDRLMLMRATRMQLSPIFGLFADDSGELTDSLYANLPASPMLVGSLGPVRHEAWPVTAPDRIEALADAMRDRPIFIADGHHRYTTALNYLAELESAGPLPPDHPARFVMFVCVSMHDPGLAILPTHRVVSVRCAEPAALVGQLAARLGQGNAFRVQAGTWSAEQLESLVLERGCGWFGVKAATGDNALLLHLADANLLDRYEPTRGVAFRRLDVAVLHRFLIDEVLKSVAGDPAGIEYPHNGRDVAAALEQKALDSASAFGTGADVAGKAHGPQSVGISKIAFLLAPTPLSAVRDVCLSGELMPQKSTFFYPKLATGLALNDLAE